MASERLKSARRKGVDDIRDVVTNALIQILKPVSSLALDTGISIEGVYQLLRLAAVSQLVVDAKSSSIVQSISGIAAVTGIPRAEVSKLLKRSPPLALPSKINEQTTNAILAAWREDSRFTNANGQPASLSMYGRGRSFERLAKIHGRGIPTRALVEELKRTRSITVGPDQIVHQNASVAVESGITNASVKAFGERVSELTCTLLNNMKNSEHTRLVSRVSSKHILPERVPLVRREVTKLTEHYLAEVQELLGRNSNSDAKRSEQATLSITTYIFEDPQTTRAELAKRRKNYRRAR